VADTPREAVAGLLDTFQRIVSCLTDAVLRPTGYAPSAEPLHITTAGGPARLRGRPPMSLRVTHGYRLVESAAVTGPWRVQTTSYLYDLIVPEGPEILLFHWHPNSRSHVTTPHLHLRQGAQVGLRSLAETHIPTGPVKIWDVVRLAIAMGAVPRRRDWEQVLTRAESSYAVSPIW
jgi:hypothetical protein